MSAALVVMPNWRCLFDWRSAACIAPARSTHAYVDILCVPLHLCRFEELRSERIAKYQGMNLYVKNLHDDIEDEALRAEFSQVGVDHARWRLGREWWGEGTVDAWLLVVGSCGRAASLCLAVCCPRTHLCVPRAVRHHNLSQGHGGQRGQEPRLWLCVLR